MEIILATSNQGKLAEMQEVLGHLPVVFSTPENLGSVLDVVEDGNTFAENALKKARAYVEWYGKPAIADDSGLEVDALDGAPGVFSKRWLGEDAPERDFAEAILKRLSSTPLEKRGAQFRGAVAIAFPDGRYFIEEGAVRGTIADVAVNEAINGLPYRRIFFIPKLGKLYQDLTKEEHREYNHRWQMLTLLSKIIEHELAQSNTLL